MRIKLIQIKVIFPFVQYWSDWSVFQNLSLKLSHFTPTILDKLATPAVNSADNRKALFRHVVIFECVVVFFYFEDGDAGEGGPRRRKVKNRILHLTELMPDATFQLVAQYGTSDQPMYVMEMEVCDQVRLW